MKNYAEHELSIMLFTDNDVFTASVNSNKTDIDTGKEEEGIDT